MTRKKGKGMSRRDLLKKATLGALALGVGDAILAPGGAQASAAQGRLPSYIGPLDAAGGRAVWDLQKADRQATPTRERVCLNGLWRWQPAEVDAAAPPSDGWGFFKVPGSWPGITDYMQKDTQTVFANPAWANAAMHDLKAAWYERTFAVPAGWDGRRIALSLNYLNSFATVFVDGRKAGEMHFPGGELDLTELCKGGATHTLSLLVVAMPLRGVMLSFSDSASAKQVRGSVARRGLCGDLFLVGAPAGPRIDDVRVSTSVRKWQATFEAALDGLAADGAYRLQARISDRGRVVKDFASDPFKGADLKDGRIAFTRDWRPDRLWDTITPENQYDLRLSLADRSGTALDEALPVRFGFREFWIDGRDFYLNGSRFYVAGVPLDNAQLGAAWATYERALDTMKRLQGIGINFVYTHNYGCEPGTHLGFAEILRAADDAGMPVSFSMPHFGHYSWDAPDADTSNGYALTAAYYVRAAQNHPSVVCYSMSHNGCGYAEDMNPAMIDGIQAGRDQWSDRNMQRALRAEAIVLGMDPSRFVYHHAGGNIGSMHTSNFYPNFAPVQELDDWFEHWATAGVKPMFTCEYGAPFAWDWTTYRGWYKGKRNFGSAVATWEFCLAEWDAQFYGDRAFDISAEERQNMVWEAAQWHAGNTWHRWDFPHRVSSGELPEREPVYARYITENWRAYRTWGLSGVSPWTYGQWWTLRPGADTGRVDLPVDWEHLQRPGFSPDYVEDSYQNMAVAYKAADWTPTLGGEAVLRNNAALLAYIAGKPDAFTSKDHSFVAGATVEKQIVVINNSRRPQTCELAWSLGLPSAVQGTRQFTVETGQQLRVPLRFDLPGSVKPGQYELNATARFGGGEVQSDAFSIDVMTAPAAPRPTAKMALFDPKGETRALLDRLGVRCQGVDAGADLAPYDVLVVGKGALGLENAAPDISRVREGLRVVVFEQTADVMEKRFGFRALEHGLRNVFRRVPGSPSLAGLTEEHLHDWAGAATLTAPQLKYELDPKFNGAPTVEWAGVKVTRAWRCGNRGNVASVLVEKPACGDFLPIIDGGFSLQYSPLMLYREGKGMVLFCQMDVTGRTEQDPAAEQLAGNILAHAGAWQPGPERTALYAGDDAGLEHLKASGLVVEAYAGGGLAAGKALVVGPGGGRKLSGSADGIARYLKSGGALLAIGLDEAEANAFLPTKVTMANAEYASAIFAPSDLDALTVGIGPADVHNRDVRQVPLVTGGARLIGNGVLARGQDGDVVFFQLVPWTFDTSMFSFKRTFRRTSCAVSRVLANVGCAMATPLLERFSKPAGPQETRFLNGFYLDQPEEMDDPYRFFRW
jgi:beta-galactosidase